jgi:hypothetical protein
VAAGGTHHLDRFGLYELKDLVPVNYGIKFDIRA